MSSFSTRSPDLIGVGSEIRRFEVIVEELWRRGRRLECHVVDINGAALGALFMVTGYR